MAQAVSKIHIALEATASRLGAGLNTGLGMIRNFASSASGILGGIGGSMFQGIFQGIGQRLAGSMSTIIGPTMDSIDALSKQADLIGIGTDKLAAYRHAAGLAGISQDALDGSLLRMTRRLALAAEGGGPAAGALEQLGLSAEALARVPADQKLKTIADALENVQDQGQRSAIAFQVFGQSGMALPQMLRGGSEALEESERHADSLGISLDRVSGAKVELANDAIANMNSLWEGFIQKVTVALAPTITALAETLTDLGNDGRGAADFLAAGFENVGYFVARIQDVGNGVLAVFEYMQAAVNRLLQYISAGLARVDAMTGDRLFGGSIRYFEEEFQRTADGLFDSAGRRMEDALAGRAGNAFLAKIEEANREAERIAATVADRIESIDVEASEREQRAGRDATPAALQQGTTEALRAIQAAQRQEASLEELQRQQIAKQEEQTRLARRTTEALERLGVA